MNTLKNSKISYVVLFAIMVVPFFYYDYFSLLTAPPIGTHIWRQTDSASFAWCFWKNGMNFFQPQILNRSFGNGFAVSEFPILQYIIALLYAVFGFHWWISKLVYVVVYFSGLAAIFHSTKYFIKDLFWAYILSLLFFTAPAMVFYGNSCVPDVAALSFSFIGFSFFLSYQETNKKYFLWLGTIFFCLAGLMKITYLLLFISSMIVLMFLFFKDKNEFYFLFKRYLFSIVLIIAINLVWNLWAAHYNEINDNKYFLNKLNPIWYDDENKAYIFTRTYKEWALHLFASPTNYLFLFSILLVPIGFFRGNKFLALNTFFLILGTIVYYLLWYLQFLVHDYYTILFYAMYLFSFLNMLAIVDKIKLKNYIYIPLKIACVILLMVNMFHVKSDLEVRYKDAYLYPTNKFLLYKDLAPYLKSIGIKDGDYVCATTDGSPQTILCALQQPGFTAYLIGKYTPETLAECKSKGAKFFFIMDTNEYKELIEQLNTTNKPIGHYKEALIYKL